jgi:hypothetical protein
MIPPVQNNNPLPNDGNGGNDRLITMKLSQFEALINKIDILVSQQTLQKNTIDNLIAERNAEKETQVEILKKLEEATKKIDELNNSNGNLKILAGVCGGLAIGCVAVVAAPVIAPAFTASVCVTNFGVAAANTLIVGAAFASGK